MLEIDNKNKQALQLSADAFFSLFFDEPPLDEQNQDEIDEVRQMFKYGFYIDPNYETVEGEDLIEATFYPYKPSEFKYDLYYQFTTTCQIQIKRLNNKEAQYRWYDSDKGTIDGPHTVEVLSNNGAEYIQTLGKSIMFFKGLNKA